jgi:hypothetical protein
MNLFFITKYKTIMRKNSPFYKNIFFGIFTFSFFLFTCYNCLAQVGIATTTPLSTFEVNGSNGQTITTVTSDLTLDATHSIIVCSNDAVTKTITLPSAVGIKGRIYNIKRAETSIANVSIATTSSQMIDGYPNIIISHAKESISVISDGANWKIIGSYSPQLPVGELSYFSTTGSLVSINASTIDGSTNMFLCNPLTTLSTNNFDFSLTDNAGLKYTGKTTKSFRISATVSALPSTSGAYIYQLKKTNSSFLATSRIIENMIISEHKSSRIEVFTTLEPNDSIELWIGKIGGTGNVLIKSLNLFAVGI